MNILIEIRKRAEGAVVAVILLLGVYWWTHVPAVPAPSYHEAAPAPQLAKTPTEAIKPPQVVVYAQAAKKKLDLPAGVQADQHAHVIAASRLPADDHAQTVTTVIDDQTGLSQTLVREEPLPWLAAEQRGYARLGYGIKTGSGRVTRLAVGENLIQVKALHFGVDGTLDSDGQGYAGVHVEWQW